MFFFQNRFPFLSSDVGVGCCARTSLEDYSVAEPSSTVRLRYPGSIQAIADRGIKIGKSDRPHDVAALPSRSDVNKTKHPTIPWTKLPSSSHSSRWPLPSATRGAS